MRGWRGRIGRMLVVLAACLGCAHDEVAMAENRQVCRTEKEVVAALGKVCAVVGTYDMKEFHNQKGGLLREWPVVVLEGGGRPVLVESLWDASKAPSAETIARYRGHRVEVVGMLRGQPPGSIANIAVPCVSPVDSIRLVTE